MIDVTNVPSPYTNADAGGCVDNAERLQEMIDGIGGGGPPGALYFPPGVYRIDSTLTFPNRNGYHVIGSGMAQAAPEAAAITGARAALVWGGESTTDPMVEIQGTGLVWDGLTLWGKHQNRTICNPDVPNVRANIGIKIRRPSAGSLLEAGKVWFPALMIDDCATGIEVDGGQNADSCAVGYYFAHDCDTCVHLDGAKATMFTFGYIHPLAGGEVTTTVFKVTNGGRVYVHSINIVSGVDAVLDIQGGDLTNSFFHINGVTGDGNNSDYHLLKNTDSGDGLTHVRFTNAHLIQQTNFDAHINIDRSNSTNGQTVVELDGCRGLSALAGNVVINGPSAAKKSRLIVRDSELADGTELVVPASSSHYTDSRIKNWRFGLGLENGTEYP